MIYISHRGNLNGVNSHLENSPNYIHEAIERGFDVEIDVWKIDEKWFLGHDVPEYEISKDFLLNESLWCHAKNLQALKGLLEIGVKCFWHQNDKFTLTSNNFIWTFPGFELTTNSICVMPERFSEESTDLSSCAGVCSDIVEHYRRKNG